MKTTDTKGRKRPIDFKFNSGCSLNGLPFGAEFLQRAKILHNNWIALDMERRRNEDDKTHMNVWFDIGSTATHIPIKLRLRLLVDFTIFIFSTYLIFVFMNTRIQSHSYHIVDSDLLCAVGTSWTNNERTKKRYGKANESRHSINLAFDWTQSKQSIEFEGSICWNRVELAQWECNLLRNKFSSRQNIAYPWHIDFKCAFKEQHFKITMKKKYWGYKYSRERQKIEKSVRMWNVRVFNKLNIERIMMQRDHFRCLAQWNNRWESLCGCCRCYCHAISLNGVFKTSIKIENNKKNELKYKLSIPLHANFRVSISIETSHLPDYFLFDWKCSLIHQTINTSSGCFVLAYNFSRQYEQFFYIFALFIPNFHVFVYFPHFTRMHVHHGCIRCRTEVQNESNK